MIDFIKYQECLKSEGIEYFTGVPDTLLNDFCMFVNNEYPSTNHIIAANEGNAIGLAAGFHLASGTVPMVYMQNSGIGNATNPLLSLTNPEVYSIPMILLIGWRGDPAGKDHPHHSKQGAVMEDLLNGMGIPFKVCATDGEETFEATRWAAKTAKELGQPVALLAKKRVFEKGMKESELSKPSEFKMTREDAIRVLLENTPQDSIFLATTGRATRELYELRNMRGEGHDQDFLNVGSMGHSSSIALGISLVARDRLVVNMDGDSAAMMHMGAFTTIGAHSTKNIFHVVLNNGAHESVGGQSSAGFKVNFTGIAENAGYQTIGKAVSTEEDVAAAVEELLQKEGPVFLDIHIRKGMREDIPKLGSSLLAEKEMLMKNLQGNK